MRTPLWWSADIENGDHVVMIGRPYAQIVESSQYHCYVTIIKISAVGDLSTSHRQSAGPSRKPNVIYSTPSGPCMQADRIVRVR